MEAILASVVLPAIIDLFKGGATAVSRKFFGQSLDDQLKLQAADIEKLKAVAALDTPVGTPSQWVIDLRASYRYICATLVILVGCAITGAGIYTVDEVVITSGLELIGMPFGFIFGERMLLSLKGAAKK